MTRFDVTEVGAKGDGETDDTAAILEALNEACSVAPLNGSVYFPAGRYRTTKPISPESPLVGKVALLGDGDASEIAYEGTGDLISFDLSKGSYRFLNSVAVEGISLLANASSAPGVGVASGYPINLDYGNDAGTAAETNRGCAVRRVSCGVILNGAWSPALPGAGWTSGPRFNVCCNLSIDDLFLYGDGDLSKAVPPASGPGSGYAMQFLSCENGMFEKINTRQWNLPIFLGNAGNEMTDCQGLMFSKVRGVGVGSLFKMVGTKAQFPNGLAGCGVTDYMCDNGYSGDWYQGAIEVDYGSDIKIDGGWMQSGSNCSAPLLLLNGCSGIRFSKSKLYCGMTKPIVLVTGGTSGSFVEGANTILGSGPALQVDEGALNNKVERAGLGTTGSGPAIVCNEPSTMFV